MPPIRAVTFGFEDTLYAPRDREQFEGVCQARLRVIQEVLTDAGFGVSPDAVRTAYQPPAEFVGPAVSVRETLDATCRRLDIDPPQRVRRRLVRALDELAGQIRWQRAPGAAAVLRHLRQHDCRLGLVANAHFPSSRAIRQMLGADGTLMYFQAFAFSDEVGVHKPDPAIFQHILYHLDAEKAPGAVVHVGDDPQADIAGARAVGMRTVRYAGFRDTSGSSEAEVVIHDFRELPEYILG